MFNDQQRTADELKRLIEAVGDRSNRGRAAKRRALHALQEFEAGVWNPRAFVQAVADTGERFSVEADHLVYAGNDVLADVQTVLARFATLLPQPKRRQLVDRDTLPTMTTAQAAEYLNVELDTMKKYVYRDKTVRGALVNPRLRMFSKVELDKFAENMPKVGPPFKPVKTPQNEGTK